MMLKKRSGAAEGLRTGELVRGAKVPEVELTERKHTARQKNLPLSVTVGGAWGKLGGKSRKRVDSKRSH